MKRYCLTLDLKDDPVLIAEYRRHQLPERAWPEVAAQACEQGILREEIYLLGTRLVMLLETTDGFSWERKCGADRDNPKIQAWETMMWEYQQPLTQSKSNEKMGSDGKDLLH